MSPDEGTTFNGSGGRNLTY